MMLEVTEVRYLEGYTLWLSLNDGTAGTVDLEQSLWGTVFEPLRRTDYFRQVVVSDVLHTIVWPNGADFAPEYLKDKMKESPCAAAEPDAGYGGAKE